MIKLVRFYFLTPIRARGYEYRGYAVTDCIVIINFSLLAHGDHIDLEVWLVHQWSRLDQNMLFRELLAAISTMCEKMLRRHIGKFTLTSKSGRKLLFSFGTRHRQFSSDCSPGPAHFVRPNITRKGRDGTPQYSLYGRHRAIKVKYTKFLVAPITKSFFRIYKHRDRDLTCLKRWQMFSVALQATLWLPEQVDKWPKLHQAQPHTFYPFKSEAMSRPRPVPQPIQWAQERVLAVLAKVNQIYLHQKFIFFSRFKKDTRTWNI